MFEQEGSGGRGGGGGLNMCADLKGDESDGFSKKTSLYITRLVMFIILECLMLYAVSNPVFGCSKQRVKSFIIYVGSTCPTRARKYNKRQSSVSALYWPGPAWPQARNDSKRRETDSWIFLFIHLFFVVPTTPALRAGYAPE